MRSPLADPGARRRCRLGRARGCRGAALRRFRRVFNAVKTHFQQVEKRAGVGGAQLWALSVIGARPGIRGQRPRAGHGHPPGRRRAIWSGRCPNASWIGRTSPTPTGGRCSCARSPPAEGSAPRPGPFTGCCQALGEPGRGDAGTARPGPCPLDRHARGEPGAGKIPLGDVRASRGPGGRRPEARRAGSARWRASASRMTRSTRRFSAHAARRARPPRPFLAPADGLHLRVGHAVQLQGLSTASARFWPSARLGSRRRARRCCLLIRTNQCRRGDQIARVQLDQARVGRS